MEVAVTDYSKAFQSYSLIEGQDQSSTSISISVVKWTK